MCTVLQKALHTENEPVLPARNPALQTITNIPNETVAQVHETVDYAAISATDSVVPLQNLVFEVNENDNSANQIVEVNENDFLNEILSQTENKENLCNLVNSSSTSVQNVRNGMNGPYFHNVREVHFHYHN